MTIYGYARVSTDKQDTALQLDALARANVSEVYADDGVSGTIPAEERPEFAALSRVLVKGDVLVVYALSRLGRSTLDVLATVKELGERGVVVHFLQESMYIDAMTPMGAFQLTIFAAVAQLERDQIAQRTKDGLTAAKARGAKLGRPKRDAAEALDLIKEGYSLAKAAEITGVSESTIRRARRAA